MNRSDTDTIHDLPHLLRLNSFIVEQITNALQMLSTAGCDTFRQIVLVPRYPALLGDFAGEICEDHITIAGTFSRCVNGEPSKMQIAWSQRMYRESKEEI